jgi:hypothetical protein
LLQSVVQRFAAPQLNKYLKREKVTRKGEKAREMKDKTLYFREFFFVFGD